MPKQQDPNNQNIFDLLKRLLALHIENIRLLSAEKLTIISSGVALFAVLMVLMLIAIIFFVIGLANLLEEFIAPCWTYFIITGILILIMAAVVLLKDKIIVNPIARFLSKLFLDPPKNNQ